MGINKYVLAILLLTSLFLMKFTCKKLEIDCTQVKYNFQLPVKAYPNKDSINIGDTLWLEINESVTFKNTDSSIINYGGAENLGTAVGFQLYNPVTKDWIDAVNKFAFYLMKGTELKITSLDIQYRFSEQNSMYVFKLGVLPKQQGLFRLVFSNSGNTYRKSDKCTKANSSINFKETTHNRHLVGYLGPDVLGGDLNFYVK